MAAPEETATKLIEGVREILAADADTRAEIGGEVVDKLFGTDPTAFVSKVPGLTPTLFEMLTDAIKDMVVERIKGSVGEEEGQ